MIIKLILIAVSIVFLFAKEIRLQLNWLPQFEFAGYIIAKEKGFYEQKHLDVKIIPYNPKITVINTVLKGKADFGVEETDVFEKFLKGRPLIALMATYQQSPHALMAVKEYGIKSLKDLISKKVAMKYGKKIPIDFKLMLNSKNISLKDLKIYPVSFYINDLINKKYDAITIFISNEPFLLKQKGYTPSIFAPKDYGFDFYSGILFTTLDFVSKNPLITKNFLEATKKGWLWAFNHIDESVDIIYRKYNPLHKSKKALKYEAEVLKKLAFYKNIPFGEINPLRLKEIEGFYKSVGIFSKRDVNDFIYSPNKIYLTKEEKKYLQKHKIITMCNNPDWIPIEYVKKGNVKGIVGDVLSLIQKKLGVKFKIVKTKSWNESQEFLKEKKCDILPAVVKTDKREEYMIFTKPYIKYKLAIITKDIPYIQSLDDLKGKIFSRKKGSGLIQYIEKKYPSIKVIKTKNYFDSFLDVESNKADFTIATLPVFSYYKTKYDLNLHIANYLDKSYNLRIGVNKNNKVLRDILEKALEVIPKKKIDKINNKYMAKVVVKKEIDTKTLFIILMTVVFIISILIYREWLLKRLNAKLDERLKKEIQEKLKIIYKDKITECYSLSKFREDKINLEYKYAVIMNVRNFSKINAVYGFKMGDKVLGIICKKLKSVLNKNVYRLDSDEFVFLSDDYKKDIENVEKAFNSKIRIDSIYFRIGFYFGVVDKNPEVLKTLSIAIKKAKENNEIYYLKEISDKNSEEFVKINGYLIDAVDGAVECKIEPYFQGIVDKNRKFIKYESLARLVVKDKVYTPYHFIDIARASGFLIELTNVMIEKSFEKAKECGINVSINLTEEDFNRDDLVEFIEEKRKKYSLKPEQITFEILENVASTKIKSITEILKKLESIGYKIAVDDFGVDNSNFEKILDLDIDYVKIDGKYIKNIENKKAKVIVESIIYFSHLLGFEVIAEFVENENIFNILKEMGVDYFQGYYFSKPEKKECNEKENKNS